MCDAVEEGIIRKEKNHVDPEYYNTKVLLFECTVVKLLTAIEQYHNDDRKRAQLYQLGEAL